MYRTTFGLGRVLFRTIPGPGVAAAPNFAQPIVRNLRLSKNSGGTWLYAD